MDFLPKLVPYFFYPHKVFIHVSAIHQDYSIEFLLLFIDTKIYKKTNKTQSLPTIFYPIK